MKSWNELSIAEKADVMKLAIEGGVYDLDSIRSGYNEYAKGGKKTASTVGNLVNNMVAYFGSKTPNYPVSQYKPTKASESSVYYAVPELRYDVVRNISKTPLTHESLKTFNDVYNVHKGGLNRQMDSVNLGNYKVDTGQDERGRYISYYDKYDWNLLEQLGLGGKPFEIYDRIYEDEWPIYTNNIDAMTYAKGGKIHINPSKKGTFTAAAKKHGKSVQAFASQVLAHPENYSPAMRKKANFARNFGGKKKSYGGELGNYYDGLGDAWNFLKTSAQKTKQKVKDWCLDKSPGEHLARLFTSDDTKQLQQTQQKETLTYRNRPAERRTIVAPSREYTQVVPIRQRRNNSPTEKESESYENAMRSMVMSRQNVNGGSNPEYDIPYIPEKKILINGNYTSTNVLDSLAKYAGIHNRNPQLSQYPIHERSYYKEPRKLDKEEWLGLSTRETKNGAQPYFNQDKDDHYNRVIGNSNYFTAFGYIPADNLMRNYQYTDANVDKLTPPILDAFRYYAQGDYNAKRDKHKRNVIKEGEAVWNNPEVKKWWELSGKYWYNNGRGPED